MKIDLTAPLAATWKPVKTPLGEFEVLVRQPTYEQQANEAGEWRPRERIESVIADWRGISDENDKPIPFHFDAVAALCQRIPAVFVALLAYANEAYRGLSGDDAKNSEPPSSGSSAAGG